ncbi:hypothetical protein Tco_1037948 [Tanacetum coccineum]
MWSYSCKDLVSRNNKRKRPCLINMKGFGLMNSKDISTVSYVDLYTQLKRYEQHAMKTLSKMNQTSGNADPLAYMAQATQSTSSPS